MRFPGSEARHARHIGLFGIEMISRLDFFLSLRTGHDRKSMCNKLEMTSFQNNFIHVSLSRGSIFDQDSGCDGFISTLISLFVSACLLLTCRLSTNKPKSHRCYYYSCPLWQQFPQVSSLTFFDTFCAGAQTSCQSNSETICEEINFI